MTSESNSFLSLLLKKQAMVINIGETTGTNISSAYKEVNRQIKQALENNPITGEGVTKSGIED